MSVSFRLFAVGNPLFDMQVTHGQPLLEKYGLKPNDAVRANDKQQDIYDDIVANYTVTYVAGGAAQNAARAAAYILPPRSVVYTGCVGSDELADKLRAANAKEGVESAYQVAEGEKTGACAVIITGNDRSLCTTRRAADLFTASHLSSPDVAPLIEAAKYFYVGGFFLTHAVTSALELANHAAAHNKVFALNLSAPYIAQHFVDDVLPYVDILFGNESEALAYAETHGISDKDIPAIALAMSSLRKVNTSRPRLVVITQGAGSTVVASMMRSESRPGMPNLSLVDPNPKLYPVPKLADDQIVDTNGAGDMFAGGFMGAYVLGKSLDKCVKTGHRLGQMCVGSIGATLTFPKENVL